MSGLPDSDLINQELITEFRKQFGMIQNDFNMALTDFDMKVKVMQSIALCIMDYVCECHLFIENQIYWFSLLSFFPQQRYEVPIVMKAVFDYIDTLSTRIKEIEQQRNVGVICNKEDKSRSLENFLSRFVIWFKYTVCNTLAY